MDKLYFYKKNSITFLICIVLNDIFFFFLFYSINLIFVPISIIVCLNKKINLETQPCECPVFLD
jgi:hypothetical protein